MKKRMRQAVICCCLGLFGISAGPVEAQQSWSDSEAWSRPTVAEAAIRGEGDDNGGITPSHVFQATQDLIAEIEILRESMGLSDYPNEAEPQEGRAPVHVYAKTLEVMRKVARIQRKFGLTPAEVGQIPVKTITPEDAFGSVQTITEELRRLKSHLVIKDEIQPAPLVGGKTPTFVYKNLGNASFLLDGLVGHPLTPNDVYGNVLRIHDEMELIALKLGAVLELAPPAVNGRKRPKEVAQQLLRATYKVINLQNRLGMDASSVPTLTLVRVTPSEVFEFTNLLLAEMARMKMHLNIEIPHASLSEEQNKTPADVFAQVLRMVKNLDTLAEAAAAQPVVTASLGNVGSHR